MIHVGVLEIMGSPLGHENRFPVLRDHAPHKSVHIGDNMPEEIAKGFGAYAGYRVLPYKIQDDYDRKLSPMMIKTVVLENAFLKATFLPEYGARLYSLFDKTLERELLTVNPVFQLANLAIRNAWFSGGIEWNVGQIGHTFQTCEDVYFGQGIHPELGEFLRMYEYERCKKVIYAIEFYLPEKSKQLFVHTRLMNTNDEDTSIYYWANTAVSERNNARVFSETDQVVYVNPSTADNHYGLSFGYGQLPDLENIEGDVSYPSNFSRSNEYFIQTPTTSELPWEAVTYDQQYMFYECSSKVLRYRKMFCWGTHKGGLKWQNYLSHDQHARYVEIQAGLFPTQLHGSNFHKHSEINFLQAFGAKPFEQKEVDWHPEQVRVKGAVLEETFKTYFHEVEWLLNSHEPVALQRMLHEGKSWGYIENERLQVSHQASNQLSEYVAKHYVFTKTKFENNMQLWLEILMEKSLENVTEATHMTTFMTDLNWQSWLEKHRDRYPETAWLMNFHLGIMMHEALRIPEAICLLEMSVSDKKTISGCKVLGDVYFKCGNNEKSLKNYEIAHQQLCNALDMDGKVRQDFYKDYFKLLKNTAQYMSAWTLYQEAPENFQVEEILHSLLEVALILDKDEFLEKCFDLSLERLREGDNTFVEAWQKYQQIKGIDTTKCPFPENLDFRMT